MNILSRFSTSLRKCAPFLLCFCLLLCCTACAAPRHQTEDRLQAIQKRGYLEVCTEPYFAPFWRKSWGWSCGLFPWNFPPC